MFIETKRRIKMNLVLLLATLVAGISYSCSPASPKLKPEAVAAYEKIDIKNDTVSATPVVDILFVIDNSGSMTDHQMNLANNIDLFTAEFAKVNIDYHIGVISTDMDTRPGELLDGEQTCDWLGNNCKGTGVNFITPKTTNGLSILKKNILIGTDGSGTEASFDPLVTSFNANLTKAGAVNAGFLRKNAYLAVIFITDADDQSYTNSPVDTFDFLVNLKGAKRQVLSYGIVVPSGVTGCPRDDGNTPPRKIEAFLSMSVNAGGAPAKNVMNLCDPQYGQKLAGLSKDMIRNLNGVIKLNKAPVISSIKVFYGTQEIPPGIDDGWYYDPKENAVILGDNVVMDPKQPDGSAVKVTFDSIPFEENGN